MHIKKHFTPLKSLSTAICFLLFITALNAAEVNGLNSQDKVHVRTLAASCAACHGTHGNSAGITPVLAGLDADYFKSQMLAFKNSSRESTVMHHHAKGLNDREISNLADYFQQQNRVINSELKTQTLEADHD